MADGRLKVSASLAAGPRRLWLVALGLALLLLVAIGCTGTSPAAPTATAPASTSRPLATSTAAAVGLPTATPAAVRAQPGTPVAASCRFVRGFEQLVAALGRDLAGDCVENERSNPTTGDVEQQTTRGLLAWSRADNTTSFTAGLQRWYACPDGVTRRPSDEPFACGAVAPTALPVVAAGSPAARTGATPTAAAAACPGAVAWHEARSHVGKSVTIQGPVVRTHWARGSRGQPTFLDLGAGFPNPDRLTVVIWVNSRAGFPSPPEELYRGTTLCVSGTVSLYQGVPQIEVASPLSLVVVR